ncbi:flagellar hook-length control protein FliK [Nitratireductor sp. StC3]|uniref:flagellar hook-length control protein FliK n=1 Tax=Nitratireductor sp. StC3 TaxID=2126741 RepID=UPI000D0D5A6B|nr:flagellar hook-length control protein FliK [Nitratireductor sp. StC3]PSM18870.1 hypothetical protein C7T96_08990 [Nitratireductor sp. StC3]
MTEISGPAAALPLANARLARRDGEPQDDAFSGILQRGPNKAPKPGNDPEEPAARRLADPDDTAADKRQPAGNARAEDAQRRELLPAPVEGPFALLRHPGLALRAAAAGEHQDDTTAPEEKPAEDQPVGEGAEPAAIVPPVPLATAEAPRRTGGPGLAGQAAPNAGGDDRRAPSTQMRLGETVPAESGEDAPRADQPRAAAQETGPAGRAATPMAGEPAEPLPIKIKVLAETSHIGLGPAQPGETVSALAKSIAADRGMSEFARAAASPPDTPGVKWQAPVRDLTIQLQPLSLGTVNARLRTQGEQLTVEIRVDNAEAFQRLSAERDALTTSLRGLGFKVDDVSIVQQPASAQTAQAGLSARDGNGSPGFSPGAREQNENRSQTGDQSRHDRQEGGSNADARTGDSGSASGGIYI